MYCTYAVLCSRVISHPPPPPPHPLLHQNGGIKKYKDFKKSGHILVLINQFTQVKQISYQIPA